MESKALRSFLDSGFSKHKMSELGRILEDVLNLTCENESLLKNVHYSIYEFDGCPSQSI